MIEDFNDNDISEYDGDQSDFATAGTFAYGSGFGLDSSPDANARTLPGGIATYDKTVSQGEIIRYRQYVATGFDDEVCTLFGVQSPSVTNNSNYAVCLGQFSVLGERFSIAKNVKSADFDAGVTVLASTSVSYTDGWYEVEINWQADNTITATLYNPAGVVVDVISAVDGSYTSGGFGFTFWGNHGGWDNVMTWPRTDTKPVTYVGVEQGDGGASWKSPLNTVGSGYTIGETARLRIAIENTGLDITNQNFRLEFAPKLTAPTCQAVSSGSFVAVPPVASCGSSALCMATSSTVTNDDPTTDHLAVSGGPFTVGKIVANTTNQTTSFNLNQNRYTELEYALRLTSNAVNDAYCFRVTNAGTTLDSYALLPELSLAFDPILNPVSFNGGINISLTPGATTTISATSTVTDFNGVADLGAATTTFYTTAATASCTPDENTCYIASGAQCTYSDCTATSCLLTCSADFSYHTTPTDLDGGQQWYAFVEVRDQSNAVAMETSPGLDVWTMRSINVSDTINYGTVGVNSNTGTFNPTVALENFGNENIDVNVSGSDMTDGVVSVIPASQQRFSVNPFTYNSCVGCTALSPFGNDTEIDLPKPTTTTPYITDTLYWGISVPFGTASNPHSGLNTFMAIPE